MDNPQKQPDEQTMDRRKFLETCTIVIGTASILSVAIFQGCSKKDNPMDENY